MSTSNTRSVGSCCFRVQKFESIVYKNKNYEDYAYDRHRPNILCVNDLAKRQEVNLHFLADMSDSDDVSFRYNYCSNLL